MRHSSHHRLLFWPVGIVSLVLIPIVLGWHLQYDQAFREPMGMELNLFPHDTPRYAQCKRLQLIGPEGNWRHFVISEGRAKQTDVLDSIHQAIRLHASKHDTTSGIWITLEREASYANLVLVLDWLNCEGLGSYVVDGPDIWVSRFLKSSEKVRSPERIFICGMGLSHHEPARPTRAQVFRQMLSGYSFLSNNNTYPVALVLAVIWGGILILNISRIRGARKPIVPAP